jgi:hypothetical protein
MAVIELPADCRRVAGARIMHHELHDHSVLLRAGNGAGNFCLNHSINTFDPRVRSYQLDQDMSLRQASLLKMMVELEGKNFTKRFLVHNLVQ